MKPRHVTFIFVFLIVLTSGFNATLMKSLAQPSTPIKLNAQPKLVIVTRHDSVIYQKFAEEFAKTQLAHDVGITQASDLSFLSVSTFDSFYRAMTDPKFNVSLGWGGGPTLFNGLIQEDAVSPITDPDVVSLIKTVVNDTISGAEMIHYDDSGQILWAANAISSFGFTVNHKVLKERGLPVPETWEDLASPRFYTSLADVNVGMGNAPDTTSNTRIYQIILQKYGWERGWQILYSMAGNGGIFGGSVETRSSVIQGKTAAAMTIDFYGIIAMQENPDCEYIIPKNASIVNGDPIALAKNPKNLAAANAFLKFLFSIDGQKLWLDEKINRLPIRADAFDTPEGQARPELKNMYEQTIHNQGILFNETLALSLEEAMRYHFEATITQVHDKLRNAWSYIANSYLDGDINETQYQNLLAVFGKPAITMEEAQEINQRIIEDDTFRVNKEKEWRAMASQKYDELVPEQFSKEGVTVTSEQKDISPIPTLWIILALGIPAVVLYSRRKKILK